MFSRILLLLMTVWFIGLPVRAQSLERFISVPAFLDTLHAYDALEDATLRTARVNALWSELQATDRIPFAIGNSVAMLYRGSAGSVAFAGDFNGWNPAQSPAEKLPNAGIWIRTLDLPTDARTDYKIVRNGNDWILDPENARVQMSGFGPNSELRMPAYEPSPFVDVRSGTPRGTLTASKTIQSATLGYAVSYRVYTPPGYDDLEGLPVLYTTDGPEYTDPGMGATPVVLDNMLADGLIRPVIAVFVSPIVGGQNIRHIQYLRNPSFATFFSTELVPAIDAAYRTDARREARAILGTSYGGLNAAYFAHQASGVFGLIAMQSPAFQPDDAAILDLYRNQPAVNARFHMTWGTLSDGGSLTSLMELIMRDKGYDLTTKVTNEGHSWGQWRALLDDVLLHFWPATDGTGTDPRSDVRTSALGVNTPNPFRNTTRIPFDLDAPADVELAVYDLLGRRVAVLARGRYGSGAHNAEWNATGVAAGTYFCRLDRPGRPAEIKMVTRVN